MDINVEYRYGAFVLFLIENQKEKLIKDEKSTLISFNKLFLLFQKYLLKFCTVGRARGMKSVARRFYLR